MQAVSVNIEKYNRLKEESFFRRLGKGVNVDTVYRAMGIMYL